MLGLFETMSVDPVNSAPVDAGGAIQDGDEAEFQIDTWAAKHSLTQKTVKVLRKEDLASQDALCLLDNDEINSLGLSLGQRKIFKKSLESLSGPTNGVTSPARDNPPNTNTTAASASATTIRDIRNQNILKDAGNNLDFIIPQLSLGAHTLNETTPYKSGSRHEPLSLTCDKENVEHFDPRTMLTLKSSTKKALHIHNFLNETAKRRLKHRHRDVVLSRGDPNDNPDTLVVRTDDSHPYAGISICEWAAANCRIMNQLLSSGDLARCDVEFYLAYTATIMDLGCTYEWSNILDFDHNYREQQAAHSFQWGYINPMMKMQYLTNPRPIVNNRRVTPSHQTGNRFSQGRSSYHRSVDQGRSLSRFRSEDCRQWLATGGRCTFGDSCRYNHPPLASNMNPSATQFTPRNESYVSKNGQAGQMSRPVNT